MVAHTRLPSLEHVSPQRRSTTVAALRRGQISISEPVPVENSGPSPVWKSSHPTDSVTGFGLDPEDHDLQHQVQPSLQSVVAPPMLLHHPEQQQQQLHVFTSDELPNPPPSSHGQQQPLRHKRSSITMRETATKDAQGPAPAERAATSAGPSSHNNPAVTSSSIRTNSTVRDSVRDNQSAMSNPQVRSKRRSGSIRLAFRKMFGRKDRPAPSPTSATRGPRHEYHQSESALTQSPARGAGLGLTKVAEEYSPKTLQKSLGPQQQEEYISRTPIDTPRLPFPMNINAPDPENISPSPTPGAVPGAGPHRRRATLPSIAVSPAEADTLTKFWNKADEERRTPTPLIGLAITSNTSLIQKRRSRSADALHEMANAQAQNQSHHLHGAYIDRRRSAEIKYWRSTSHGIPETEEHDEAQTLIVARSQAASIIEIDDDDDDDDSEIEEQAQEPDKSPQPNEDLMTTAKPSLPRGMAEHSDRLALQASVRSHSKQRKRRSDHLDNDELENPTQVVEAISRVDGRLSQMEFNMAQLAQSMQALSGREPSRALLLDNAPKGGTASPRHLPPVSRDVVNAGTFPPARSISLKHQPSPKARVHPRPSLSVNDLLPQSANLHHTAGEDGDDDAPAHLMSFPRPPSVSVASQGGARDTIHNFSRHAAINGGGTPTSTLAAPPNHDQTPATTHSMSGNQQPSSPSKLIDQLAPLYNALRHERSVRKTLEAQVGQLQRDMYELTGVIAQVQYAQSQSQQQHYPTRSPDYARSGHPYLHLGGAGSRKASNAHEMDDSATAAMLHGEVVGGAVGEVGRLRRLEREMARSPSAGGGWASPAHLQNQQNQQRGRADDGDDDWSGDMF